MMFGLRITLLLLLAAGTKTVKGLSTTVPTRGDGLESSTVPAQGSSTTVSTAGGSSTTESTTAGSSTTAFTTTGGLSTTDSTTTGGVTTTDCPPGDRLWLLIQALLGRLSNNGWRPTGGHGGASPGRWPNIGRGGPRGGFQGNFRPRNARALPSALLNNLNQDGRLSNFLNNFNQDGQLTNFLNNFNQDGQLSDLLNNLNEGGRFSSLLKNLNQGGRFSSLLNNLNQGGPLSSLLNNLNQAFRGSFLPRNRRGLKIYDLIRGNGITSRPTRPSPTQPTGQKDDGFNLADALLPAKKPGQGDFQENVLQKLDTIHEEVQQIFRLLPRIIAQRPSK